MNGSVNGWKAQAIYNMSFQILPAQADDHFNLAYWHYDDFLGIGAGASGKEGRYRYDHTKKLETYLASPASRILIPLSLQDQMFEQIMMNLRLKEGIKKSSFFQRTGVPDFFRTA